MLPLFAVATFSLVVICSEAYISNPGRAQAIRKTTTTKNPLRSIEWKSFDTNHDGRVSLAEFGKSLPYSDIIHDLSSELMEDSLIRRFMKSISTMFFVKSKFNRNCLYSEIFKLFQPVDVILIFLMISLRRKLLKGLFQIKATLLSRFWHQKPYEDSLFYYLDQPMTYFVWTPVSFYLIDIMRIFAIYRGIVEPAVATKYMNLFTVGVSSFVLGSFITKTKDWGTLMHSYTHTLIHSYTHTLIHSYTHTLIHSYTYTLIHSYTHR